MQKTIPDNSNSSADYLSNDNKIDLGEILATLVDNKWLIAFTTLIMLALGVAKALIDTPIYKADAMLQIEAHSLSLASLESGTPLVKNDTQGIAEIELINSRTVLGLSLENLKLDIIAKPKYFPVIGEAIAKRYDKNNKNNTVSSELLGQNQYAWGGESIKVEALNVPSDLLDKELLLIAGNNGTFQLVRKDEPILTGEVGKLAIKQLNGQQQPISIVVSMLRARPDTQFTIMRQSEANAINQIRKDFQVSEKGKFTSILELTLESSSPESSINILNEIINIYILQNIGQKSDEAQKTLDFLENQLPSLKAKLDASIKALNDFRSRKGSIDFDTETKSLLESTEKINTEIILLQQKREDLRQKFTESYPSVIAVDKQIARLKNQISVHDHKIEVLPEIQQEILKLSRNVNINTELYTTVLNNAQTLRVAKAGAAGDLRVIDYAALPNNLPIKPKKMLIVAFSFILGLVFGVALSFISRIFRRGIVDPDLIENTLHIPVYATVPHSTTQERLSKKLKRNRTRENSEPLILSVQNKDDLAIESLRSLRTTLHFAFLEAQNNIIMITSPSPGVGKTFVSINLAAVLADAGKKILLIDGDLRKGYINKALGVSRENGLSELILNTTVGWPPLLDKAIHRIPIVNLDFISTGTMYHNTSELLLHERFGNLLASISKNYDHVIIDSPPILAVTDASIIGRLAGATLMVAKSGEHPMRELEQSAKRLTQAGVNLKGIVFNDLPEVTSRFGHNHAHNRYVYEYSSKK
ncbi:polysaccharide biosynthesis tyrosine autokinase [Methyloglobulus sp.]|uniref:polysaccharide biosynthesis tyrosine autokinase n=1 Tax=Methyloglobulus sp. TaxID=2518622 RepID=UPI0032B76BD5